MHQRYVHPGPLVLRTELLKYPAPTTDRDRTVSRRSEPSSRTTLIGEQPNPWDRIQPQDSVERWHFHSHTTGSLTPTFVTARPVGLAVRLAFAFALSCLISVQAEPTFERLRYALGGDRPSQTAHLTMSPDPIQGRRLEFQYRKGGIPRATPQQLTPLFPSLPPILYIRSMGSFRLVAGNRHLHRYYNFAGRAVETVPKSLHHSCGSELT